MSDKDKVAQVVEGINNNQLVAKIRDSAQHIWLAGLGAYAKAQAGSTAAYERLLAEGEAIQNKTRVITEERVAEIAAKATGKWDKLEKVFESRVASAMKTLGVTSKKDIDALTKRIDKLAAQVKVLNSSGESIVKSPMTKDVAAVTKAVKSSKASAKEK